MTKREHTTIAASQETPSKYLIRRALFRPIQALLPAPRASQLMRATVRVGDHALAVTLPVVGMALVGVFLALGQS